MLPGRARALLLTTALTLSAVAGWACGSAADTMPLGDAYVEVYVAIEYRAGYCGHRPGYPLLILDEPPRNAVGVCAIAIAAEECPFNDYPLVCLELYNTDVPGIGLDDLKLGAL